MKLFSYVGLTILLLSATITIRATKTYIGNAGTGGFTFNFNTGLSVISTIDPVNSAFYAARTDTTTTDAEQASYAIAGARSYGESYAALTPEIVTYNTHSNTPNPLYGQKISLLNVFNLTPLAVCADNPSYLYWINSVLEAQTIFVFGTTNPLNDAQGASGDNGEPTAGIVQICPGNNVIYAAVKKNGGNFGDIGGGIATVYRADGFLAQYPAVAGDTGIKAAPLDITSTEIGIHSSVASLSNTIIDLHWSDATNRLYVTFQAIAANGVLDGARSIVVGYVNNGVISFYPFAPATAFTGTDYIVGAVGASVVTTIHKFRTMYTSTSVLYGIVLGNADDQTTSLRTVYALPLVNKAVAGVDVALVNDTEQGVLASKDVDPGTNLVSYYNSVNDFTGRGFQVPAAVTNDLTSMTDLSAMVGGGQAPGDITDITAYKDAVFISINNANTPTQASGIFYSQALFDEYGAIKAWTPWTRCYTSNNSDYGIFAFGYQGKYGQFYTAEGTDATVVKTYKTTIFNKTDGDGILGGTPSNSSVGFVGQMQTLFSTVPDGIQMVNLFPSNHAGLSQTANQQLSLMTLSGYNQLAIVQTGSQTSDIFSPTIGDFATGSLAFTNGALNAAASANTQLITVSGGALETIGSIATTTLINDGNYCYLVVGGVGGVAVLKNNAGQGWPTTGLQKNFSNLGTDKYFQIVGTYQNVRKVWADGTNLYVLTAQQLDRIPAGQLAVTDVAAYTIATPEALLLSNKSFSDVITSNKLGLLATSAGLYRTANGVDISTLVTASYTDWTAISLADSPVSVTRLYPLSTTGLGYDCAQQDGGGNVYVLAAAVAQGLSVTYRFTLADISATAVTDATVQPFHDYLKKDFNSGFIQWGNYRNFVATDGSRTYAQRAAYLKQLPVVEDASLTTVGQAFIQREHNNFPFDFTGYSALAPLVRTETGSIVVAGNNGLQVLE